MFEIHVSAEFEAAHRVAGYPGKCDRLHGHSWTVEAVVAGDKLDELGMLVDFKLVKGKLRELLEAEFEARLENDPYLSEREKRAIVGQISPERKEKNYER